MLLRCNIEFYEERGAIEDSIAPLCIYSVIGKSRVNESGKESFGMLYVAEVCGFFT